MSRRGRDERVLVTCTVNGRKQTGYVEPRMLLCDFLRHELHHYGTHVGCEHGVCGACTVKIDGRIARSCLTFAVQSEGAAIETVEGLAADGELSDLQQAFSRHGALQCGFCTAGILVSTPRFLEETPTPSEAEVRAMLSGHLCRCTGYDAIVRAILEVAAMRGEGGPA